MALLQRDQICLVAYAAFESDFGKVTISSPGWKVTVRATALVSLSIHLLDDVALT